MTYIVMTAPGCYGDYATVYSRHNNLASAIRSARRRGGRAIVSDDGGYAESHQPGSTVHREFASRYRIHWHAQSNRS